MENLTLNQRRALAQLQDLTNGGDDDVAVSVLGSVQWDVQRAAELIFGTASMSTPHPPPLSQPSHIHILEVDDSQQGEQSSLGDHNHNRHRPEPSSWSFASRPASLLSFFAFPFRIISNLFRFVFSVLRIPIPQLRFTNVNFYRPIRPRPNSRGGPDRWVRELEEETGAICIGRAKVPRRITSSGTNAGPSTLMPRPAATIGLTEDGRKVLPDFTFGSYEETLRTCEREAKVGCVILVSEEHDDVTEFKRTTLTDPGLVKLLYDNDVIVWGGDVRDQEAWSAAKKLQATTYPFVAFLALQPRRNPISTTSGSTTPSPLTVLSRHQGRCVPASAPTSAQTLIEHLQGQVLPRVTPFLERIRSAQRERDRDRHLREEQDRAFQDSARRDKERIEAKMTAEKAEKEARRRADEQAQMEDQRRAREAEATLKRETVRMDWRRWARRALVAPDVIGCQDTVRIAIRLPTDKRVIRHLSPTSTLTTLYAYVDSLLIPPHFAREDDPAISPEGNASGEAGMEQQILLSHNAAEEWWGFKLVLAYPRREIVWKAGTQLGDVESLKGGGQVAVEMLGRRRISSSHASAVDEDGYSTEDSDQ